VIHGSGGFNIAQIIDDAPADIDLMKDNLQEAIGGAGNDVSDNGLLMTI
jgi:hypothetical protein